MNKHIPNIITLGNLLCGSVASFLIIISDAHILTAVLLIIAGAVLDFLDGFVARLLKAYSELGKQLDSLADLISFGFAPAAFMSLLVRQQLGYSEILDFSQIPAVHTFYIFFPFIITAFSALRLAKFNIDTRQTESFIGMPTPGNTLFIISIVLISLYGTVDWINSYLLDLKTLLIISALTSLLLVSPIPMFSLKFKNLAFKANKTRYIFLIAAIIFLALLHAYSLFAIMLLYVSISIGEMVFKKKA